MSKFIFSVGLIFATLAMVQIDAQMLQSYCAKNLEEMKKDESMREYVGSIQSLPADQMRQINRQVKLLVNDFTTR